MFVLPVKFSPFVINVLKTITKKMYSNNNNGQANGVEL